MTCNIQRSATAGSLVFTLSGRLNVESVKELERVLELEANKSRIVLDLKEVTLVDRDAVQRLVSNEADGITLLNCPAYIREWMTREGDQQ